jgi:tRNA nucleotidyltransferase (CCA-adding enzyme)
MKSTQNMPDLAKTVQALLDHYPLVRAIALAIANAGGRSLLVGGAVRDILLGLQVKDLDIEVHNLTIEQLETILRSFGPVSLVGKVFGVLRLHGLDVDWSLPRADQAGRKPVVELNPSMSMVQAFRRRDLTMNAMGIDLITYELIDPFNGAKDLQAGVLRAPDENFFVEDPLRFYRVMQFIGRFQMLPDEALNALCARMDIKDVSVERIETEFHKLLLRSKRPSLGIRWLRSINRLQEVLPEVAATIGVEQEPAYHPEGDVFEHSMQALDAAAALEYDSDHEKLIVLYASLCHDLGKVTTSKVIDGVIKSYGHAQEGAKIAKQMLKRFTRNKDLIDSVVVLVDCHMQPLQLVMSGSKPAAYKRLARKLAPHATMAMLAKLALADRRGRNGQGHEPLTAPESDVDAFLDAAQKANVVTEIEQPVLHGRDLLDIMQPGPEMGELLKAAYEIQIDEGITDKDELKRRVLKK